ncbi:testis-expressed sequence 2 -like protein [Xyrichtys novacula]|uniref:Testis-expressed sequence 2 -like protein n=1 Tax=Xyrichtys novacula TaxID=13765 RepID=A0AAV1HFJ7_XYRNO|nr:testis-expressed sequence 2 -like protein [Xyrichtys novacula]
MVICKETCAVIIALHKKGFTGKDIAASKVAPKTIIYQIIKTRGSVIVRKASGRRRKSIKSQDCLSCRIGGTTSAELAQEWQQAGVSTSTCTVRRRLLEEGLVSRRAAKKTILSRKKTHKGQTDILQKYRDWTPEDWGKVIFFPDCLEHLDISLF